MANLMRRAADELNKRNAQLKRIRENNKAEEQQLLGGGAALAGAVTAAAVDRKYGEGGEPAKVLDFVPAAAAAGAVAVGAALAVKSLGKARLPLGGFGLGMLCGEAYRFAYDRISFDG